MVSINYATREVSCKIVYYGPGLSGKTTNLQYVHMKVPSNTKGKLISLATDADRTLYFDFLPINIGTINGFAAKFQLYTVPGQVYYNATRKLVLRGVDGLVFVADSQPDKMDENIESLSNLKENLAEYGYRIEEIPIVIQYNKQDLPNVLDAEALRPMLNPRGWPEFAASATEGFGVFDTLKCILKLVLEKAKTGGTARATAKAPPVEQPAAAPASSAVAASAIPPAAPPVTRQTPVSRPAYSEVSSPTTSAPAMASPRETPVQTAAPPAPAGPLDTQPVRQPVPSESAAAAQQETVPPESESGSWYRPFPGNTLEDEKHMLQIHDRETPSTVSAVSSPTAGMTASPGVPAPEQGEDKDQSDATALPRMAPPLKADRPRKKRSFFKRLFGLK